MRMASSDPGHWLESLARHCSRETCGLLQYNYACAFLVNVFLEDCAHTSCEVHSHDYRMLYNAIRMFREWVLATGAGWSTSVRFECTVTHKSNVVKQKSVLDILVHLSMRRRVRESFVLEEM